MASSDYSSSAVNASNADTTHDVAVKDTQTAMNTANPNRTANKESHQVMDVAQDTKTGTDTTDNDYTNDFRLLKNRHAVDRYSNLDPRFDYRNNMGMLSTSEQVTVNNLEEIEKRKEAERKGLSYEWPQNPPKRNRYAHVRYPPGPAS